jgi:hypothetical protein
MNKNTIYSFLFLIFLVIGISSCDDKININADYTTTPVVFALLDHADSIHYIKITKTFLGNGNNYDFAKVPDSSYFREVDAKIIELKDGEKTGREWQLRDSTVLTKKEGIFYNPEQKVYVFYEKGLLEDHEYRLEADLNEGAYQIDATTTLIDGFAYNSFFLNNPDFTFASASGSYIDSYVRYSEGLHAAGYQTRLYINYKEVYQDDTEAIKQIVWSARSNNGFDTEDINPDNPDANRSVAFRGESFYSFVSSQLEVDPNVKRRNIIDIDVVTEVGHEDLMKYIEVSKPSTGLAQTTPLFTNVNGGLGLFSSRHLARRTGMGLSSTSTEILCTNEPTNIYKFCSTLPTHNGEFFSCF